MLRYYIYITFESLSSYCVKVIFLKEYFQFETRKILSYLFFRNLQLILQQEMERSSALRAEIQDTKVQFSLIQEKEAAKYQSLQK
jgi:hypothetical protein